MSLAYHAKNELSIAGLLGDESDYDGMLGRAVLELITVFAGQGHSGYSAMLTIDLFSRLANYEALTPLTDDPDTWMAISDEMSGQVGLHQSIRNPAAFSNDAGKTYYLVDENPRAVRETVRT